MCGPCGVCILVALGISPAYYGKGYTMSKKNAQATKPAKAPKNDAPQQEQPAGAAGATAQAAKVLHLEVKMGVKLRGARGHWYQRLTQYHGKPASEYLASCKENPPSLPKSGVAEPPQGWLSYFQRTGVVALV